MGYWRKAKKLFFVLPSMAGTILFYLFPLCYCFLYAFSRTPGRFTFGGLENYNSLFHSDSFRLALGNTWLMMAACVGSLAVLSLFFVYILDASKGVLGVLVVLSMPMLLPATLITRCMEGGGTGSAAYAFADLSVEVHGISCFTAEDDGADHEP